MRVVMKGREVKVFALLLVTLWVFSGWPQITHNPDFPPSVHEVRAASSGPANCGTGVNATGIGSNAWSSPQNACTTSASASGVTPTNYLKVTNFGFSIPTGAQILGIQASVSRGTSNDKGGRAIDAAVRVVKGGVVGSTDRSDGNDYNAVSAVTYGSTSDLWGETWTAADINSSGFGIAIASGSTKNNPTATINAFVTITVTYNAPPNNPSQDSPLNNATGVSVTPTFLLTATDPDSDNVSYKVTLYSNSGCSVVVESDDQSVTSTGWSGTNATCTASPTSCYSSGTQGTYALQSSLSASTQYWWHASAKDPDGSGAFATSSSCNTFTTGSANSLPVASGVSIDSGAVSVTLTENTTTNVVCAGTVTDNDGFADITSVTGDLFRTGVGIGSALDDNDHYRLSGDAQCVPSGGTGNIETYTCTFAAQYFVDPTDTGSPNAADNWTCTLTPSDSVGQGTAASDTIEMDSLIALALSPTSISYGTVAAETNTGATNQTVTITNTGNRDMDPQLSGTNMTSGPDTITVSNQEYSAIAFTYGAGTALSTTPTTLNLTLPQQTGAVVTDDVLWGLGVPAGTPAGTYTGTNTFTAAAGI